ncbi:response regulator transcription factor [Marinobacterium jannaschii]|uniref:response regulator transcription factor n=1 Tax=Marinobacterium jannaschii TaxID=64970 RepID=UPI000485FE23|nr:response regulator transcription factor [Marinobacterium jannaschii]
MKSEKLIYVVDDEKDICDLVCLELERFGYQAEAFHTGEGCARAIGRRQPDLCIVDLGLPDMDGLGLVRTLCEEHQIGVMILSGRGSLPDRVLGLELGADDYITKPFDPRELIARVNSLLRRLDNSQKEAVVARRQARFADWQFDTATLTLSSDGGATEVLSSAEADLLNVLLNAPKQILSRDQLMGEVMGRDAMPFDRSIDVRMSRIRRKLEADPKNPRIIKTVYGAGYMLAAEVVWS